MKLPAHPDIESAILALCLRRSEYFDASRIVEVEDFSIERHQRIWRRMCELYDAGEHVDVVTLGNKLESLGERESVGGLSYLLDLDFGVPDVLSHIDGYLDRLKDATMARRVVIAADNLVKRGCDGSESGTELASAWQEFGSEFASGALKTKHPLGTEDLIAQYGIEAMFGPIRHRGLVLPWTPLDDALHGIGPGQVILLMAETSRGKTSMALQIATSAAIQGYTPLIWTMEMSPFALQRRMVTQHSGVPAGQRLMDASELRAQRDALAMFSELHIRFDDKSRSVSQFGAALRYVRTKVPKLGLGVIDYIQKIPSHGMNRAQEVSANSRAIQLLASDMQIPMLVLSQVDRGSVKGEGKIGLHSGKESGDIENDADVVLWIDAGELSKDQPTGVALNLGKQREGPAGFSLPMLFYPTTQVFEEYHT